MIVINSVKEMVELTGDCFNRSRGFVPTMGALHEGHISLLKKAAEENREVYASVFVNPTQFGENEDFSKYPRVHEKDIEICREAGVDVLFIPCEDEMYFNKERETSLVSPGMDSILCGHYRPGHFAGVMQIVLKLLNLVKPGTLYLGQKDAQQGIILKKMARELFMPVRVTLCPIIREKSGLALSSRNMYLTREEREAAPAIHSSLKEAEKLILSKTDFNETEKQIKNKIEESEILEIQYLNILDSETLQKPDRESESIIILAAVYTKQSRTRLIDNIIIRSKK